MAAIAEIAEKMVAELKRDSLEGDAGNGYAFGVENGGRVGRVKRYLAGDHDLPYMPRRATNEYRATARKAITNWLPLISATYCQGLFVDGYRPARVAENALPWASWQANGMDARQSIAIRSAIEYGVGYGVTLPGADPKTPVMRAYSALRMTAWYEDEDDDWPVAAILKVGETIDGATLWKYLDAINVYTLREESGRFEVLEGQTVEHDFGVCPVVRFRIRLGDESTGIISSLIPVQDRLNETVFMLSIALQYASFRQRWATGIATGKDPATGEDLPDDLQDVDSVDDPAFEAAVDRLWTSDSHETRFGDFAQTDTRGHLDAYNSAVRTLAALGQISPNVLTGDLVNLSADALATLQDSTQRHLDELKTLLGESFEQWLRLTAYAAGDGAAAMDLSASVRWRDTESRALAATVDALGKMVQMLNVPPQGVWERIPGVTDDDVERWKNAAESADGMALLAEALNRQGEPVPGVPADAEAPA